MNKQPFLRKGILGQRRASCGPSSTAHKKNTCACHDDLAALFECCMDADPSKRPTAAEIAESLARAEQAKVRVG